MTRFTKILFIVSTLTTTMAFAAISDRVFSPEMLMVISGRNFEWPGANAKNIYKTSGHYVTRNIIATRHQIYKDEAIIAFPRYKPGVPFTLGLVKLAKKGNFGKPNIAPFPSWTLQEEGNCDALQNVVDIFLDENDIVWVLDIGVVNTLDKPIPYCSPKVVAISAKTEKVIQSIDLSDNVSSASRLQYITVEYAEDSKMYAYISDGGTRAIISYDVTENRGFRVVLPKAVTLGCAHQDVLYMSLVRKRSGSSSIYFTYLGSSRMYSVASEDLRSGKTGSSIVDVGAKQAKIVFLGTDGAGALFFRNKGHSDIYMWNVDSKFDVDNFILVQKGNDNRFPTHVVPGYKKLMWVLESNFHDYIQNNVGCSGPSVLLHPLVKSAEYL